ncbi:MAG: MFS transporter [Dehalococcoidia bacterium]
MTNKNGQQPNVSFPLLVTTVALGGILAPLNSTMLVVALPEIRRSLDIGHAEIGWLVSAYLIAMAVAQPLGGRLGDQLGRARVFQGGLMMFLLLSVAAAFSPTFEVLIVLRTGQALVGAAVIPNGMAMMRESVPIDRLGRSNGLTGSAISLSAAVGPLIGAGLLAAGSWRLLFLMNVPLVLAALVSLTLLRYPMTGERRRLELDWAGAGVFAVLLGAVTVLLNSLQGGESAVVVGLGVIGLVVFTIVFVQRQRSTATPIAEWGLFRNRSYAAATSYILLANLVMYTTLLTVPFFIEEVQGYGSGRTGLLLGSMSILMAVLAPLSGRVSDAQGRRLPAMVGATIMVCGVAALVMGISADVSFGYLAVSLAAVGLGLGLSFGAAQTAAVESAPRELAGAAAGANSMMRYLGSIVGAGVLGAVLSTDGGAPDVGMFRLIYIVLLVMAALAAATTLLIHRFPAEAEEMISAPAAVPEVVGRG